jgi:hypothetical protein
MRVSLDVSRRPGGGRLSGIDIFATRCFGQKGGGFQYDRVTNPISSPNTFLTNELWAGEFRLSGASAKQIANGHNTGRDRDGWLEIFQVGTNSALYHNWQTAPNGSWAGETRFANDSAKWVAVGRNADGRLEIFYVGTNDGLYHNWQTKPGANTWAGETRFANDSAKVIAVGQNLDGRLEIFYVGTNNFPYHNWQTRANATTWAGETRFPNASAQWVAVGQNTDGRLEIFYVGTNNDLYHNWQTTANSTVWGAKRGFPTTARNISPLIVIPTDGRRSSTWGRTAVSIATGKSRRTESVRASSGCRAQAPDRLRSDGTPMGGWRCSMWERTETSTIIGRR